MQAHPAHAVTAALTVLWFDTTHIGTIDAQLSEQAGTEVIEPRAVGCVPPPEINAAGRSAEAQFVSAMGSVVTTGFLAVLRIPLWRKGYEVFEVPGLPEP